MFEADFQVDFIADLAEFVVYFVFKKVLFFEEVGFRVNSKVNLSKLTLVKKTTLMLYIL